MSRNPAVPPAYCITGHGRSGTSFIAEMLQSAGLDIGQRLMPPADANPRGHFEDMEFHEFHVAVLRSHGFGDEGFIGSQRLCVPQQLVAVAQTIVQRRRQVRRAWGWKEPRSTLFLDFWSEQVPELRFLLLFRRPWDVIDSLFRRGDPIFHKNPNLAAQVWLNYNQRILDFCDRLPERCLLIESHAVAPEPRRLTEAIVAKFGDYFGPIGDVFEDRLFRHEDSMQQHAVLAHFFPETITVYEQLRSRAPLIHEGEESGLKPDNLDWALQHWIDFRRLEARDNSGLRSLRAQLAESQGQLRQAQADLEGLATENGQLRLIVGQVKSERDEFRARLVEQEGEQERARAEVEQYRTGLARVESERDALKHRLADNEAELDRLNRVVKRTQAHLDWVATSRFWKLRRFWLRVRSPFRGLVAATAHPAPGPAVNGERTDADQHGGDAGTGPRHQGIDHKITIRHGPTRSMRS